MPSVRVKKHPYSSLSERPGTSNNSPRSLATLFRRTPSEQDVPLSSTSGPGPQPETTRSPVSRTMRQRSGSLVQGHLQNLQNIPLLGANRASTLPRSNIFSPTSPQQPRVSVDSGVVVIEGASADIQVPGDGEPGRIGSALSLPRTTSNQGEDGGLRDEHHHDDIVEHLDVIDPQVATASNLTNAANSILIARTNEEAGQQILEDSLDRHVDDVMKRRAKIRRILQGVWSFLKTPLGIITGIYGFLVVFWGAAIVIFLLKIINFHNANTQGFWIEVSSQVVNGLFTVTGVGLIPSRVLDTYRISKIYSYKRRTRELRAKAGLPQLFDEDDLPDPAYDPNYVHVLTEEEEKDLHRQQVKFHHHQTWYRPHGTETHRAYPIGYALLICCLNDGNSIFQVILCGTMWGLNRFERPAWSTGCLIPLSFLCGIGSAVVIALGSSKTKRTAEVEKRLKAALSAEHDSPPTRPSDATDLKTMPEANERPSGLEKRTGDDLVDEHMTVPAALPNDKES